MDLSRINFASLGWVSAIGTVAASFPTYQQGEIARKCNSLAMWNFTEYQNQGCSDNHSMPKFMLMLTGCSILLGLSIFSFKENHRRNMRSIMVKPIENQLREVSTKAGIN